MGSPSSVSICSISGGRSSVDPGDEYGAFELLASLGDDKSPLAVDSLSSPPRGAPVLPIDGSRSAETELSTAFTATSSGIGVSPPALLALVEVPTSNDGSMTGNVPAGSPSAGLPVHDDGEWIASGEPVMFDGCDE